MGKSRHLDRGQYPFQPNKFVNLVVPSPCGTEPYNNMIYHYITGEEEILTSLNILIISYKCLHFSDYPRYLKDMFRLRASTYFLRGHNMLCLPKPLTTSYGINSFGYLAAISWNSLPDHYGTISDFTSFRQMVSSRNK